MTSVAKGDMMVRCLCILILCTSIPPILSQTVSFAVRNLPINRFIFMGETNIELVCRYSGFSSNAILQISHNDTDVIAIADYILPNLDNNYTLTTDGESAILTIKMASENTAGTYTCKVSDISTALTGSASFDFEVLSLEMGPQCWSSIALQETVATEREFYAECFYSDFSDVFYSEWSKVLRNRTEIPVASNEIVLPAKKIRNLTSVVGDEDEGVLFKCSVFHKTLPMLTEFTPCEIVPIAISEMTTVSQNVSFTNPFLSTSWQSSDPTSVVPSDPSFLDGLGLYILIAVAAAISIFIVILIVICLCCYKNSKDEQSDEENEPTELSKKSTVDPLEVYNSLPVDNEGSYYDAPPSGMIRDNSMVINSAPINSATTYGSEYVNDAFSSNGVYLIPLGPEDVVSTHL